MRTTPTPAAGEFDGALAATSGPRPAVLRACLKKRSIPVLDVLCILGIIALGVVVILVARAVEKL
ncbi:MAG: hypothetical protein ACTHON_01950 [Humibacter sp.]